MFPVFIFVKFLCLSRKDGLMTQIATLPRGPSYIFGKLIFWAFQKCMIFHCKIIFVVPAANYIKRFLKKCQNSVNDLAVGHDLDLVDQNKLSYLNSTASKMLKYMFYLLL